jgi:hypothetical protein
LLAHYTSIDVIEKILRSEEIWFSNPLFMNDLDEMRFGMLEGRGRCTICSKLHAKQHQCIVARVRRFGAKVAASFVSHSTAPDVRCHAAPHSVT